MARLILFVCRQLALVLACCFVGHMAWSQISPPGLGIANTAGWVAIGLRQRLDSANLKQSVTYVGVGSKSNPDDHNPYQNAVILVLNEEYYNQFRRHWQYSAAISYRRQKVFEDAVPYAEQALSPEQELRVYGRFSYTARASRLKMVLTVRQEARSFFGPRFEAVNERYQLRTRFRAQLTGELSRDGVHRAVASGEALFSIANERHADRAWTGFAYREARSTLYYSYSPHGVPFVFDVGYMNNLLGLKKPQMVHYLALDVIWENPFSGLWLRRKRPAEHLE